MEICTVKLLVPRTGHSQVCFSFLFFFFKLSAQALFCSEKLEAHLCLGYILYVAKAHLPVSFQLKRIQFMCSEPVPQHKPKLSQQGQPRDFLQKDASNLN